MAGAKLFISYAHEDEELRSQLDAHLAVLIDAGTIEVWHDRHIAPGMEWATEIDDKLASVTSSS